MVEYAPTLQHVQVIKIDMPDLITHLNRTPIFEWHVVWCIYQMGYQKDMPLIEIGLRDQHMISIIGSIVNMVDETYMYVKLTQ